MRGRSVVGGVAVVELWTVFVLYGGASSLALVVVVLLVVELVFLPVPQEEVFLQFGVFGDGEVKGGG